MKASRLQAESIIEPTANNQRITPEYLQEPRKLPAAWLLIVAGVAVCVVFLLFRSSPQDEARAATAKAHGYVVEKLGNISSLEFDSGVQAKTDSSGRTRVSGTITGRNAKGAFSKEPYLVILQKAGSGWTCESTVLGR